MNNIEKKLENKLKEQEKLIEELENIIKIYAPYMKFK
jgi:hypothetical protein